jgi:PBP1b-binding outer membrane lipoprotein LpoB
MPKLPWYSLLTAVILLGGFLLIANFMIDVGQTLPKDEQYKWERLITIFNTVQTLAVAAAGVLLGTAVQQARVTSAEASAKTNADEAAKAKAAREALRGLQPPGAGAPKAEDINVVRAILG